MIKVQNLTKEFKMVKKDSGLKNALRSIISPKYEIKKAVSDISFEINDGEMVGYIGANGAGKSTTIKMMTGILTPTSGDIFVDNIIPYKEREKNAKDIGVVFGQRTQLWWDLALCETFSLLKDIYEIDDCLFKKNMSFLNEILELEEFLNRPVRTLSLGQRMRADLAASLIHNPKTLYLDEPTIGLDVVVKENVRNAIKKLNNDFNTTIILTTHDLSDIETLCNRIIIIDKGSKIYDGTLSNIKNNYGYMTNLEISLQNQCWIDLNKIFNMSKDDFSSKVSQNKLFVTFNKNKLSSSQILYNVMKKDTVLDFSIKEISIEDIIKKIYKNEV